jgi:hypothetical protein
VRKFSLAKSINWLLAWAVFIFTISGVFPVIIAAESSAKRISEAIRLIFLIKILTPENLNILELHDF